MSEQFDELSWRVKILAPKIIIVIVIVLLGWLGYDIAHEKKAFKTAVVIFKKVFPPKTGLFKEYYENGKLKSETNYADGKKDGPYKEFHENGQLKLEANFKAGEIDGVVKAYDESGRMVIKEVYKAGEITYRATF